MRPPEASPPASDFGSDALGRALAAMRDAQGAEDAQKAAKLVVSALGSLTDAQLRLAMDQPAIQELIARAGQHSPDLKPGGEIRDAKGRLAGKVPWTKESMIEAYGGKEAMIEWFPHRDQDIIINGIGIKVRAGEAVTSPPIFRDVHEESYKADLGQRQTAERIMRQHFGDFGEVWDNN